MSVVTTKCHVLASYFYADDQWSNYKNISVGAEGIEAPKGVGSGEGAVPPPQKNFLNFNIKCCSLVHSGGFYRLFYSL